MSQPRLLLVDHYDSFAHNLARYCRLAGADLTVQRFDQLDLSAGYDGIILSPGPCAPDQAAPSLKLVQDMATGRTERVPLLGVCLGHQIIAQAFGGIITRYDMPLHGRASVIEHDQSCPLFDGVPAQFEAGRYHSLCVDLAGADDLRACAFATDHSDLVMAFEHRNLPVYGVQFHPESLLTPSGMIIVQNFLKQCYSHFI